MTDDDLRKIWLNATGIEEACCEWDVLGFARALLAANAHTEYHEQSWQRGYTSGYDDGVRDTTLNNSERSK